MDRKYRGRKLSRVCFYKHQDQQQLGALWQVKINWWYFSSRFLVWTWLLQLIILWWAQVYYSGFFIKWQQSRDGKGNKNFLDENIREELKKKINYGKFHIGSWPTPPPVMEFFFSVTRPFLRTFCKKCIFTIKNPKKT